jgi:hypothetical protein
MESRLLKSLNNFLELHVSGKLKNLEKKLSLKWYENTDMGFITNYNIVFLFMVLRKVNSMTFSNIREKQNAVCAGIYLAYSYIGAETGYPFTFFLNGQTPTNFWKTIITLLNNQNISSEMLIFNQNKNKYDELLEILLTYENNPTDETIEE